MLGPNGWPDKLCLEDTPLDVLPGPRSVHDSGNFYHTVVVDSLDGDWENDSDCPKKTVTANVQGADNRAVSAPTFKK